MTKKEIIAYQQSLFCTEQGQALLHRLNAEVTRLINDETLSLEDLAYILSVIKHILKNT